MNFHNTFYPDTLKTPTVPRLKDFFKINKFVLMKNVSFCIISMLKSGKYGELQTFVTDLSCILSRSLQNSTCVWRPVYQKLLSLKIIGGKSCVKNYLLKLFGSKKVAYFDKNCLDNSFSIIFSSFQLKHTKEVTIKVSNGKKNQKNCPKVLFPDCYKWQYF